MVIIRRILPPYADLIDRVILSGSRAQGRYRPDSDIDLVLKGSVDERIQTPALKFHIDRAGVMLFTREDLKALC